MVEEEGEDTKQQTLTNPLEELMPLGGLKDKMASEGVGEDRSWIWMKGLLGREVRRKSGWRGCQHREEGGSCNLKSTTGLTTPPSPPFIIPNSSIS